MAFELFRRKMALPAAGLSIALGASLAAMPVLAQTTTAPDAAAAKPMDVQTMDVPAPVKATIDKLTGGQAKILKAFHAPAGLIGLAISLGPNKNTILYASNDGQFIMQGQIITADGQNTTKMAAKSVLPKPPTGAENFATLDKTSGFVWGQADAPKELWILFDPNCIYCHKTYEALKPAVKAGKVKVHIIQAGFLKASSLGKAAAILSADDPAAALAKDEEGFDEAKEEGGIKPDMSNKDMVAKVKANNAWMQAQGIQGTPYLMYKDADGKVQDIGGYDPDIDGLLAKIGKS